MKRCLPTGLRTGGYEGLGSRQNPSDHFSVIAMAITSSSHSHSTVSSRFEERVAEERLA